LINSAPEEGIDLSRTGEYPNLNTGLDLTGEFIVHFTDNFGIGVEFGYMQRKAEGDVNLSVSFEGINFGEINWKDKPKLNVYPLFLTGYYFHPVMEKMNIFINCGAGFYFGRQSWENSITQSFEGQVFSGTDNAKLSGTAFGFKGGIGVEFKVGDNIALFVEGNGRTGTIGKLDGDQTFAEEGYTDNNSGTLWYLKDQFDEFNFDIIEYRVSAEKPNPQYWHSVREWKTKLSGLTGLIGIRISFGTKK